MSVLPLNTSILSSNSARTATGAFCTASTIAAACVMSMLLISIASKIADACSASILDRTFSLVASSVACSDVISCSSICSTADATSAWLISGISKMLTIALISTAPTLSRIVASCSVAGTVVDVVVSVDVAIVVVVGVGARVVVLVVVLVVEGTAEVVTGGCVVVDV